MMVGAFVTRPGFVGLLVTLGVGAVACGGAPGSSATVDTGGGDDAASAGGADATLVADGGSGGGTHDASVPGSDATVTPDAAPTAVDGGSDATSMPDVQFTFDAPVTDSALTTDSACAQAVAQAQLLPLDMYVMLDRSGSMGNQCPIPYTGGNSKMCYVTNALASYFESTSAGGNRAALNFFAINGGTCGGNGGTEATPYVPLTALPVVASSALVKGLINQPNGSIFTPTEAGLRGIVDFTAKNVTAGRVMIGILLTDGDPDDCDTNLNNLATILSAHRAATGIKTYVVGMNGATFSNLETLAVGGGAPAHTNYCDTGVASCHYYSVNNGNAQAIIAALKAIQQTSIGCSFPMPTTTTGIINPSNVVVEYTASGQSPTPFTRATNQAACTANGWYYDNNTTPTQINLCPTTCTTIQNDPAAKINLLLGCLGS